MRLSELMQMVEKKSGNSLSFEPIHELFSKSERLRVLPHHTLHNHPYCRYVKSLDANRSCAMNKRRTIQVACCGHRFCGACPYGLWEWVQPVMFQGKLAAILYFGPYLDVNPPRRPDPLHGYDGPLPPKVTEPDKDRLRVWAPFLAQAIVCEMELALQEFAPPEKKHGAKYYCGIVQNLIAVRFMENLCLRDAAAACHINANYLSNLLKSNTGKTFRQLLVEQRIIEAQVYLKYRIDVPVTEIARRCGFQDSNYFSAVFHHVCGVSPSNYRKSWYRETRQTRP